MRFGCRQSSISFYPTLSGMKLLDVNLSKQHIILETNLPSGIVQEVLERSGNTVVFRGHGYSRGMKL